MHAFRFDDIETEADFKKEFEHTIWGGEFTDDNQVYRFDLVRHIFLSWGL